MLSRLPSRLVRYGVAVLVVVLMTLVKVLIDPWSDQQFTPFLLFFGAVMVSALFGGLGPGLLTTLLAAVVGVYLFFSPAGSLLLQDVRQALWLLIFLVEGLAICWLSALLRRTRRQSQEAFHQLQESEERFRATFEQAAVGIAHIAPDGSWLRVNDRLCEIVSYPREELLGKTFQDITHPDDLDKDLEQTRKLLAGEIETYSMEKRYFRKDGFVVWINLTGSLVWKSSGEPDYFIAVVDDITRRKRFEGAQARLAAIVESSDDAIIGKTLDGTITSWNLAAEKLYGYSSEEAVGKPITILVPPDRPDEIPGILEKVRQGEKIDHFETVRIAKDGRRLNVSITVSPIKDSSGNVVGASANARDITKRKRSEEALRESEERFKSAFESTPIGMALVELENGRWLEVNQPLCDILGYSETELLKLTFQDVTHPDDLSNDLEQMQRLLAGEIRSYRMEKRYVHKEGRVVWCLLSASLVRDLSGEPLYGIAQVEDITGRKAAEEKLTASEAELRALFEAMTDLIFVVDGEGRYLKIAPTDSSLLYKPPAELLGKTLHEVFPKEQADAFLGHIWQALERGRTVAFEYDLRLNRQRMWFEAIVSPMMEDSVIIVARDVTERRQAQQLLKERLGTLSHIAATLALQGPMADTLDILAESVVKASTAVACSVVLTEENADVPHLIGSHGLPEGYAESLQAAYRAGVRSPTMEVFRTRHPALVRDVHRLVLADPLYSSVHGLIREAKWDPVYIVPLISRGRALGAINFYYLPEQEPGEDEKIFLKSVADQAVVAVESARLYVEARGKATLEERQRLARELHDSVSQALYGIALGAETARELLEQDPEQATVPLDYVLSLSEAGIAEMRALIFELRPESLEEEGLVAALEKQVAAVQARHKLKIEASLCDEPSAPVEAKEAIYRITQETLNNVVKHAQPGRVRIEMECDLEVISLEISDDGVGFDVDDNFPGHLGLRSMRERASKLGGTLEVDSAIGKGTLIRAQIPI